MDSFYRYAAIALVLFIAMFLIFEAAVFVSEHRPAPHPGTF